MHVGFEAITSILSHGGIPRYSRETISYLCKNYPDVEFSLYTTFNGAKKLQPFLSDKANLTIKAVLPHELMLGKELIPLTNIIKQIQLRRTLPCVDLIHALHCFHPVPATTKLITTIHDLFQMIPDFGLPIKTNRRYRAVVEKTLKTASAIIVPCRYTEAALGEYFGKKPDCPLKLISYAADPVFRPLEIDSEIFKKYHLDTKQPFLLFVSRIDPRKNLPRILEAFRSLDQKQNGTVLVLVLSAEAKEMHEFKATYADLISSGRIKCLSGLSTNDLVHLYNAATAFVFPSLAEGFGLPAIEAMQCGCPVITSKTTSLGEIALGAAICIDPLNTEELREAMITMIQNPDIRTQYRELGLIRAKQFSWDKAATETMELYRETIAS